MTKLVKMMSKIIQGELCIYVDDLRLKNNHVLGKELLHKFFNPNQAKASTSHKYYSHSNRFRSTMFYSPFSFSSINKLYENLEINFFLITLMHENGE